jgi:hypothetical protein
VAEPSNTYGSSTTGPTGSGAYGATTGSGTGMGGSGIGGYNSGAQDSSINPSNPYGSSTTGTGNYGAGMGNTSSGTYHDSRKGPMDIGSTGGNYGSGSDNYGSSNMGGYGSSTINAGPHDSKIANKLDPRVDSDLGKLNCSSLPFRAKLTFTHNRRPRTARWKHWLHRILQHLRLQQPYD